MGDFVPMSGRGVGAGTIRPEESDFCPFWGAGAAVFFAQFFDLIEFSGIIRTGEGRGSALAKLGVACHGKGGEIRPLGEECRLKPGRGGNPIAGTGLWGVGHFGGAPVRTSGG